jgi:methionine-rich copper-binding protein CopC
MSKARGGLLFVALVTVVALLVGGGGASATPSPVEMNFACALKSNGLMRYVSNLNQCKKTEDSVTIKPGPVRVCVQPDGSVRKVNNFSNCRPPAIQLTLPPTSGTVYFCAANTTGVLRYVTSPSQCTSSEFPVFVTPNDDAPSVLTTSPANGATQVAVNANIVVNFSEPVTATTSSFTLQCPSGAPKSFSVSGSPGSSITLDPTADLPQGTTCAVRVIANQISDTDSNDPPDQMAADYNFSFATDSAPFVTSTSPANGATGVNPSNNIVVNFSEPVSAGNSSFTIECPSGSPQSFGVGGSGTSTITVDPTFDLPAATTCTVTVLASGISDVDSGDPPDNLAANYVFSFTTADSAPFVTSTSPAGGATHVATNTNIVVNFSEPVTATTSSFTVECPSGTPKSFTVSGSPGSAITLDPTSNLPEGTICSVKVIANQISDVDSVDPPDNMAADFSFSFSTDAPPAVTGSSPADGATDVDPSTNIQVFFNEPVNVMTSSFTISCNGNPQTFAVSGSGTDTITLDPDSGLPNTASCTVTAVAGNISDSDTGDPPDQPAANVIFSFTTQDAAPSVSSTSPADGASDVATEANIDVTFSEPVTTTGSSFTLECPTGSAQAFTVLGSPGSTITLDPSASLPNGEVCTVTVIANEISDVDAVDPPDNMAANYEFSFTVVANEPPTDINLSNSSVDENQPAGTTVGTLSTTDPNPGDTFTYALVSGSGDTDNGSFQISGDQLQTNAVFDFETNSTYSIRVRSTDSGSLPFEKQFVISVTNVNEPPTDISLDNNSIDENQSSGTLVGNLSQVGDPDGGETYTFTLLTSGCSGSFPDSSSFQISGSQLQSAVSFNYEVKSSYSICVRVNDPGSPNQSFEKSFAITINNVNDSPVDGNETTSAVGNTLLEYGAVSPPSSGPKKVISGNLLNNATDEDQPPETLTISASDSTSANGGDVSVSSSGAFSYVPAAGFTGTDTFNYTVSDGNGGTDTSTVTITVASRVWYVQNNATAGGTGRSTNPFDTLAEADTAASQTGDITYVYKGDGTTTGLTGGFSLLASQKLLGEPVDLVVGADTLATGNPANRPSLSGTVALASASRVEGVDIAGSGGAAIAGTNTGGSDVTNVNLSGGAGGVALTCGAAGTFNFTNFTISTSGGTGFFVCGNPGAPTINVGSGANENVSATGGEAVVLANMNGSSSLAFDAVSSTNSSGDGIQLFSNGAATFSASSGSISGAPGNAIWINGGSGNFTYPGTIGNGSGGTARITGRTGGAISLSGDINDTNDAGGGIFMSGNTGGSTTFSGSTTTLNTGASAAFSSIGSGHTITFSGGGLDIDTTSGAGFSATGGGAVNVTGSANTIDSTTGTALNVVSTDIGVSGLNFKSISANGAVNGIVLNNTGSSGGLTVFGNGATFLGGDGSGGAILNTTGHGISLNNTRFPYFLNMNIQNTAGSGINGTQVTHFNFQIGTINNSGTGGAGDDSNISFNDGTSNVTGSVNITGSVLSNARYHGVDIQNSAGTISLANIVENEFTSSTSEASSLGSAIRLYARGSSTNVANVTKANLNDNVVSNFPSGFGVSIEGGNRFDAIGAPPGRMGTAGSGTDIISITGNRMDGGLGGPGNQPEGFVSAFVSGRGQGNFDISNNGTVANPITHIDDVVITLVGGGPANVTSTLSNNRIVANNVDVFGGLQGMRVECRADALTTTDDTGTLTSTISNNNVSLTSGPGIDALAQDSTCTLGTKVMNNVVAAPTTTSLALPGIRLFSGTGFGDTTLCAQISSNTTAGSTNINTGQTSPGINLRKQGTVAGTNEFGIVGLSPSPATAPQTELYVSGQNPASAPGTFGTGGTAVLAGSNFISCVLSF